MTLPRNARRPGRGCRREGRELIGAVRVVEAEDILEHLVVEREVGRQRVRVPRPGPSLR